MARDNKGSPPRLRFTDDEMAEPLLEKPIRKAQKTTAKVEKAESKIPTRKRLSIEQATDAKTGKTVARLRFGDRPVEKPEGGKSLVAKETLRKLSSKLIHEAGSDAGVPESDGSVGNVGLEAVEAGKEALVKGYYVGESIRRIQEKRPYQKLAKAEKKLDKANIKALQSKASLEESRASKLMDDARTPVFSDGTPKFTQKTPGNTTLFQTSKAAGNTGRTAQGAFHGKAQGKSTATSSPVSRWRQRRAIKRQYAAMKRQNDVMEAGGSIASRLTRSVKERVGQSLRHNKRSLTIAGLIFIMVAMVMNGLSSCAPLVQSGFQAVVVSTYPAEDEELKAAERIYARMENDLKDMLGNYERDHDYDEYYYDLDEIWHDPHVLVGMISAWYGGEVWTADQAYGFMEKMFKWQYQLTEDVKRETRYRQEPRTGYNTVTDPETGETSQVPYTYYVDVPYDYYIANIQLINQNLDYAPIYMMNEERIGMYAMYKSTLGNKPDIFRGNRYAGKLKDYVPHDIPQEYLDADPAFANMIALAQKYLGYPYIWGGSKPTTSFDCSGFVSWVFTESGYCNTGRLGATSLYGVCSAITEEEALPGDLVFFQGTLPRNEGITHVGIYVGDGMMIHCGDPITFADLGDRYWVDHMFDFGRPRR